MVELASGLFVNKFGLEAIRCNKKMNPSKVVRNLITLIFTRDEILNQSITGKECNNKKGNRKAATQRLDEWKINVVKDELRRILCQHKYSADHVVKEVLNVKKYIRSKLSTKKQAIKKTQADDNSTENSVVTSGRNKTFSYSEAPETVTPETECSISETASENSFHLLVSEGDNESFEDEIQFQ
ncbi:uncharacterized protein LOC117176667 [Belonocnema kinseyi]|uniref:uncharacterized protein LOC117176667 n=1 Tax=Belonocnema kinseyi TaxID=2817044 RepID=UPI00143D4DD2|nr:uncharacterized protein LOC117176667 [Belonocnema kinseyi]